MLWSVWGQARGLAIVWPWEAAGKKTGLLLVGSAWAVAAAQGKTRSRVLWVMVACLAIIAKQLSARRKGGSKGVKKAKEAPPTRMGAHKASKAAIINEFPQKHCSRSVECPRPLAIAPPVLDNKAYHCRNKGFEALSLEWPYKVGGCMHRG